MKKDIKTMMIFTAIALTIAGCGGGNIKEETEVPTVEKIETPSVSMDVVADQTNINNILHWMTTQPRPSGSEEEENIGNTIADSFKSMGYETRLQPFIQKSVEKDTNDIAGTNVIAIRQAEKHEDTAGILIISAHHDGKPGILGASDNASGVSVMLEVARLVANVDTNIELRFISFSGEEDGRVGSRFYVEQLQPEERERIIGQLQLDELGYKNSEYMILSTVDGTPTLLGNLLSEQAKITRNVGKAIPYQMDGLSDHNSFSAHGIPAVMLSQDGFVYENHTTQDKITILDVGKLSQTAQLVADTLTKMMNQSDGSLLAQSREITPTFPGFPVGKETQFYFGLNRNFVENMMATTGTLKKTENNEFGDTIEYYDYVLRLFNMEDGVNSTFTYRNGFLEIITIHWQTDTKMGIESAMETISKSLGMPETYETDYGMEYDWGDENYHKFYSLIPTGADTYDLMIMDYSNGKEIGNVYDLSKGITDATGKNPEEAGLLQLVNQVIHPLEQKDVQFSVYSDGKGNSTGFTGGLTAEDNTRMEYALDLVDAFDDKGNWRYYEKTVRTAVHEYGHVLSWNHNQVDITKSDNTMPKITFEEETYAPDAYLRQYYEQFWKGMDVKSGFDQYEVNPTDFVSYYAATNITEDFAESFMLFVLSDKPEEDSLAAQKIRFFYEDEEMMVRRSYIRENLNLPKDESEKNQVMTPLEGNVLIALEGNSSTGYSWSYVMEPEGVVEEVNRGFYRENSQNHLVGAGGTYGFEFLGKIMGSTVITFSYARPWETDVAPHQQKIFELIVDEKGNTTAIEQ